ncbi:MAG: hypothetical protein JW776_16895 [Candidatus Lokiarchaeota archaeon]|nr:hypothetical protein [Candidatus Lokiarchaeota archaeon]
MGNENPFEDLPDALVHDMLERSDKISNTLTKSFSSIMEKKDEIRNLFKGMNLLHNFSELKERVDYPFYPLSCGVDGANAIDKLVSSDIFAVAAVTVHGFDPKERIIENLEKSQHKFEIEPIKHEPIQNYFAKQSGSVWNLY